MHTMETVVLGDNPILRVDKTSWDSQSQSIQFFIRVFPRPSSRLSGSSRPAPATKRTMRVSTFAATLLVIAASAYAALVARKTLWTELVPGVLFTFPSVLRIGR
jgi:hypothetical protein